MKRQLAAIAYTFAIAALLFFALHGLNHLYFGAC